MSAQVETLKLLALFGVAFTLGFIAYRLTRVRAGEAPLLGSRGERRQRALREGGSFTMLEPMIRKIAGWIAPLPIDRKRAELDAQLSEAGYYFGLTPDELLALYVIAAAGFGVAGFGLGTFFGVPLLSTAAGLALGPVLVNSHVGEERNKRFKTVNRGLPTEIDMAAMCLGAGMDFPGALRLIVEQRGKNQDALTDELGHILRELGLGHTRAAALRSFEARVPTESVREFVSAVVQAEEKGTPLADVLRIQAGMLRMRRSIMAEEAASRAGVLMMIPLIMLLGSILLILMGSMVVKTYESGVF